MPVDAQLKVQNQAGELVGLTHVDDATSPTGRAAPTADGEARSKLEAIRGLLAGTITVDAGGGAMATEATLAAIQANTAVLEAITTELRDNQLRRTDEITLVDGTTIRLTNDALAAHAAGRFYVGGRRRNIGGALSSARYVAALRNPPTSGVVAYIVACVFYTNVTQWFRWVEDPDLASPQTDDPAHSLNLAGPTPSQVTMLTDTVAPTTAPYWQPETRVTLNGAVPLAFPVPVPIPPGKTFATVGDASSAQETCANVYFYEKPL